MQKKKLIAAVLVLLSAVCSYSIADDAFIKRLASTTNAYVINKRGSVEIAPDFKVFVASALAIKRLEVAATAFVIDEDMTLLGEFPQSCMVLPANTFFGSMAREVEKNNKEPPMPLMIYRFLTERMHLTPTSYMHCTNGEPDSNSWRSVLPLPNSQPFIFNEQVTQKGLRHFYVIYTSGVDFYF